MLSSACSPCSMATSESLVRSGQEPMPMPVSLGHFCVSEKSTKGIAHKTKSLMGYSAPFALQKTHTHTHTRTHKHTHCTHTHTHCTHAHTHTHTLTLTRTHSLTHTHCTRAHARTHTHTSTMLRMSSSVQWANPEIPIMVRSSTDAASRAAAIEMVSQWHLQERCSLR